MNLQGNELVALLGC